MTVMDSDELCRQIADKSDGRCLLAFSRGKDAIAAYIQLRRFFKTIIPYHLYLVPGLKFVEDSIEYYESIMGRIISLPHPSLYRWINNFVFITPERIESIYDADLPNFTYDDVMRVIKEDLNLPANIWTASGVRAVDSIARWNAVKKYGPFKESNFTFMPVFDWRKERLIREIKDSGIKLPVDYQMFGRSFDGIDFRFLKPLRDRFPEDYRRVLDWFPLAELEIKRHEYAEDHRHANPICFQSREQKEAFLAALKIAHIGDKYIDGIALARKLGVNLASEDISYNPKIDVKLTELT